MLEPTRIELFVAAAGQVGAQVRTLADPPAAAAYIAAHTGGRCLPPLGASLERVGFAAALQQSGVELEPGSDRASAARATAAVTGARRATTWPISPARAAPPTSNGS